MCDPRHEAKLQIKKFAAHINNNLENVNDWFCFAAQDQDGSWYLWRDKPSTVPIPDRGFWGYDHVYIESFAVELPLPKLKKWKKTLMYIG